MPDFFGTIISVAGKIAAIFVGSISIFFSPYSPSKLPPVIPSNLEQYEQKTATESASTFEEAKKYIPTPTPIPIILLPTTSPTINNIQEPTATSIPKPTPDSSNSKKENDNSSNSSEDSKGSSSESSNKADREESRFR